MFINGKDANCKQLGDFFVGVTVRNQDEYLQLTIC